MRGRPSSRTYSLSQHIFYTRGSCCKKCSISLHVSVSRARCRGRDRLGRQEPSRARKGARWHTLRHTLNSTAKLWAFVVEVQGFAAEVQGFAVKVRPTSPNTTYTRWCTSHCDLPRMASNLRPCPISDGPTLCCAIQVQQYSTAQKICRDGL